MDSVKFIQSVYVERRDEESRRNLWQDTTQIHGRLVGMNYRQSYLCVQVVYLRKHSGIRLVGIHYTQIHL
jgi:hypothetical protein